MKPKEHFHGSDLEKIEKVYGIRKENIVSFSANVNPLGISPKLRDTLASHLDAVTEYPDREYTSLRRALSQYTGAPVGSILAGNGSTELISLFIAERHPRHALLLGPTYSEYEREIRLGGGSFQYFNLSPEDDFMFHEEAFDAELTDDTDMVVLCNPNNPTSSVLTRTQTAGILELCRRRDILVMVDETYVEFVPDPDLVSAVPLTLLYDNLVVLRGISKFFAAPGLRLGYAVCGSSSLLASIDSHKNPWSINTLASIAGEIMFTDTSYIRQTRELISKERSRICRLLESSGLYHVYPAQANFVLLKILDDKSTSEILFDRAIRQGLMIRDCSTFESLGDKYIRFCFMKPEDNDRLLQILLPHFRKA